VSEEEEYAQPHIPRMRRRLACLPLCRCGQPLKAHWQTFGPILAPKSNWLGTQLTHGRWSARLYQSKSSDLSAGRAGQFMASSKI